MAITQRLSTTELLFERAQQMGLQPSWVTPNGLFAVATSTGEKFVNITCSPLNPHINVSLAKDKYFTRLILARNKLPNIPFARPKTQLEAEAFLAEHSTIIVKPYEGGGTRDIHIIRHAHELLGMRMADYIFEKYIVGKEMRYLILNGAVIAVHRSEYGTSVQEDRVLQRFSYAKQDWDPELVAMSLQIASALGLGFAAIDFLVETTGGTYVLEVNTNPGLKWFHAPTAGPPVDVASMFLKSLL